MATKKTDVPPTDESRKVGTSDAGPLHSIDPKTTPIIVDRFQEMRQQAIDELEGKADSRDVDKKFQQVRRRITDVKVAQKQAVEDQQKINHQHMTAIEHQGRAIRQLDADKANTNTVATLATLTWLRDLFLREATMQDVYTRVRRAYRDSWEYGTEADLTIEGPKYVWKFRRTEKFALPMATLQVGGFIVPLLLAVYVCYAIHWDPWLFAIAVVLGIYNFFVSEKLWCAHRDSFAKELDRFHAAHERALQDVLVHVLDATDITHDIEFIQDLDNRLFDGQLLQLRRIYAYDYMRDLIEWLEIHPNKTLVDGISATQDKLIDYRRMTADYYKSTT